MFSDGEMDYATSLDADDGRERWRLPIAPTYPGLEGANDGPVSTPAIADGLVVAPEPTDKASTLRVRCAFEARSLTTRRS